MTSITTDLPRLLSTVRCHGDFYAVGSTELAPPNLSVDGARSLATVNIARNWRCSWPIRRVPAGP